MSYIEGTAREQYILFPEVINEYITEDNPVRFIDAFVDTLNLEEMGFARCQPAATGRPGYDPADLLKLYIYGYQNRVRSSRRLEEESHRNVEVMWLIRKLTPDFKTIADFRKNNTKAFKAVFRRFSLMCRQWDLFGGDVVAIDGSKFKAVNSTRRNFTRSKLERMLKEIDEKLAGYLQQLDEADAEEAEPHRLSAEELNQRIAYLKARRQNRRELLKSIEDGDQTQVSLTDPDSRRISRHQKTEVGYNVQMAVDDKHHLIVEEDVTNAVTDRDQLSRMAIKAKGALGVDRLKVVADKGYYHGKEIKACEEAGIEPYVSKPLTSVNTKLGLYGKERFRYNPEKNCYICPQGEELTYRFQSVEKDRPIGYYVCAVCGNCPVKPRCTRNQQGRKIIRWVEEEVLDRMHLRVSANPELMNKRKAIVEHPFGTIKFWNNQGGFLMKGLRKVSAEMSLSALAYNIKRVMNIMGIPDMVKALSL